MEMVFCNSNDKLYQKKLNNLLKDIFLDFQFWYDLDLWTDAYESYAIMDHDEIVSNICVYKTNIMYRGSMHHALSIGAVATKKAYRGKGLANKLMKHIIEKYPDVPMYLSANDNVTEFYPRFGFERIYEKLPRVQVQLDNKISPIKMDSKDEIVWKYIQKRINYSTILDCNNADSINMFHIHSGEYQGCIYEIKPISSLVIAKQSGRVLKIYAVFSMAEVSFQALLESLPFSGVESIEFGFMPPWRDCPYELVDYEHDPLFIRNIECDLGAFKFPELAIT